MELLFTIEIDLHENHMVISPGNTVNMVLFGGRCDCDFFHGEILPGGVDTQIYREGEAPMLSARYMLRGRDDEGTPTRLFIENNGVTGPDGVCATTPYIMTDNPRLAWLTTTPLTGRLADREGGVTIMFYKEDR